MHIIQHVHKDCLHFKHFVPVILHDCCVKMVVGVVLHCESDCDCDLKSWAWVVSLARLSFFSPSCRAQLTATGLRKTIRRLRNDAYARLRAVLLRRRAPRSGALRECGLVSPREPQRCKNG